MRKLILPIVAILFAFNTNAQITVEHTYTETVYYTEVENGVGVYYSLDNGTISIFDEQHITLTSISVPSVNNASLIYVNYLSKSLFDNTSADYEYVALYNDTVMGRNKLYIYDEIGTTLIAVHDIYFYQIYNTTTGAKLFVHKDNGDSQIYSLPGQLIGLREVNNPMIESKPFPNPTNGRIKLPATNGSEINVYDTNGKLIESGDVKGENFELDATEYNQGMYIYKSTNGDNGRFVKQ